MTTRSKALADGTDTGQGDSLEAAGAPDDRPVAPPTADGGSDTRGPSAGGGDGPPAGSDGRPGGGSVTPPQLPPAGATATLDANGDLARSIFSDDTQDGATPPPDGRGSFADLPATLAVADPRPPDPLAAFLSGLHGLSSDADRGGPARADRPIATLLSNGLNADAGVAQFVSALASVRDGNSAFDATPFAAPSDQGVQGVIAAEVR